ncbi:MAG: type I-E CRISPR-associated protein Cas6/Cse3/CasE [Planctomycetota bacterium]
MYLSYLLINVGENPDRPRPGRLWLRNLHRVHQRLCMGFPSEERRSHDPQFLHPYKAGDFAPGHVHVRRSKDAGFLFRIDPQPGASPIIVVQSACRPDWDYAFQNARLLAAPPRVKPVEFRFQPGRRLRFRLRANPTRRASQNSRRSDGRPIDPKWVGKRIPVPAHRLQDWLARRGQRGGFKIEVLNETIPGYVRFSKNGTSGRRHRLLSVLFEGVLNVTDTEAFAKTLRAGIGTAKAYGFGLLSIAPA